MSISVPIDDVCTVVGGGTPARDIPQYYSGDIPWVTPKDMKTWEIRDAQINITRAGLDNSATRLVPANSVLVVVRSGVLKHTLPVAISRREVAINQDMKAFVCSERVDPDYLARFIKARSPQILQWVRATTADNFPVDKLRHLRMSLPPLPEQRRIAEILDKADALQAKRRAALAQLDSLTQSIFLEMFGDPATNPRGWPIAPVGEVADVQGGLQVTTARKSLPLDVPYLRVANVYRRALDLQEVKRIRATEAEVARTSLQKDDLLLVEGHGNAEEIGRSALWDGSISGCVHQNHLIRARFALDWVLPLYACEYLNSPYGRRHLLRAGKTTSGLNTINVSEVRATPIPMPPVSLQREFAARVHASRGISMRQRASLATLRELFSGLQHAAFGDSL